MADILVLNVGGVHFPTRRSTLTSPCSFFSGLVETARPGEEIFVDRDPTHFRHVLNWMRGVRHIPEDGLEELLHEADFYALDGMVSAIRSAFTSAPRSIQRSLHQMARESVRW